MPNSSEQEFYEKLSFYENYGKEVLDGNNPLEKKEFDDEVLGFIYSSRKNLSREINELESKLSLESNIDKRDDLEDSFYNKKELSHILGNIMLNNFYRFLETNDLRY